MRPEVTAVLRVRATPPSADELAAVLVERYRSRGYWLFAAAALARARELIARDAVPMWAAVVIVERRDQRGRKRRRR